MLGVVTCPYTNVTSECTTELTMAELHRVFFPDILAYIININFARVEWRLIAAILREIVVKSSWYYTAHDVMQQVSWSLAPRWRRIPPRGDLSLLFASCREENGNELSLGEPLKRRCRIRRIKGLAKSNGKKNRYRWLKYLKTIPQNYIVHLYCARFSLPTLLARADTQHREISFKLSRTATQILIFS